MTSPRLRRTVLAGLLGAASAVAVPAVVAAAPTPAPASARPARAANATASLAVQALDALSTEGSENSPVYRWVRGEIAGRLGAELGIDPERLAGAWDRADFDHQRALMAALTQLGVPYRRNTSKPGIGFDCSGLTTYAWGEAGQQLTRQSGAQIRAAESRTAATAQAGDLSYYPGHVMMYLGVDDAMVHSPYTGRNVEVTHAPRKRSLRFGDPTE